MASVVRCTYDNMRRFSSTKVVGLKCISRSQTITSLKGGERCRTLAPICRAAAQDYDINLEPNDDFDSEFGVSNASVSALDPMKQLLESYGLDVNTLFEEEEQYDAMMEDWESGTYGAEERSSEESSIAEHHIEEEDW
jgi:hypothetical protein